MTFHEYFLVSRLVPFSFSSGWRCFQGIWRVWRLTGAHSPFPEKPTILNSIQFQDLKRARFISGFWVLFRINLQPPPSLFNLVNSQSFRLNFWKRSTWPLDVESLNFWHRISFLFTAKLQRVLQPDEQQEQEEGGGEEGGGGEGGEGEGGRGYKVMAFKRKTEWTIESILRI